MEIEIAVSKLSAQLAKQIFKVRIEMRPNSFLHYL